MLANFDAFQPNAATCRVPDDGLDLGVHEPRHGLAPDRRQDPDVGETRRAEGLEPGPFRIVGRDQQGVIEHLVQPLPDRLHPAEIETPVAFVELPRGEDEAKREGITVQQATVGVSGFPLSEGAGETLVVIVGLGRAIESAAGSNVVVVARSEDLVQGSLLWFKHGRELQPALRSSMAHS